MSAGWISAALEDCIEKVPAPVKVKTQDFLAAGKYPVVSQEAALINGYWNNEADVVKVNRPLVVFGDHTQVIKYVDFDFVVGADGVKLLQPQAAIDPKFFCYQLQSMELETLGYARHYRLLKERTVQYPTSLPEQQRIVGVLDAAFAALREAEGHVERNRANARELFESFLNGVFEGKGDGWVEYTLPDIAENLDSRRVPITKGDRKAGQYPYYGASGIVDYVHDYIFDEECLLISEDGANLLMRSTPIAFSVSGKYWVNNHAHILRFREKATQSLVEHYLESIDLDPWITGAAQPKLNQSAMNSIPIWLPVAIEARQALVENLDNLKSETDALETTYQQKLIELDGLKKGLLGAAFNGQL